MAFETTPLACFEVRAFSSNVGEDVLTGLDCNNV